MATRDCPDCGAPLGRKAIKCRCGWTAPRMASAPAQDIHVGRCDWLADGRCHYAGIWSEGDKGLGPWHCKGHTNCHDAALGAQIVEQSKIDAPNPDYSYAARLAASTSKRNAPLRPSNSPLVASVRAAYLQSQAYRDKHLAGGQIGGLLPKPERQPGED